MSNLSEIKSVWDEWKTTTFPSEYVGKDVAGVCVTSVDSFAAGCIDTFITGKGRLDTQRITVLEKCRADLEIVLRNVEGDASAYFAKLLLLCESVLQSVGR
jgi:hypothetical protein